MITAISENKLIRIILTALLIVTAVYPLFSKPLQSASLTALSDTMSRQKVSENSNHTIQFDLVSAWDATETVVVDFDNGFTSTGLANSEAEDFDITWEGAEQTIVAAGGCSVAANEIEITTVDATNDVFTFTRCSGDASSAATDTVIIEIGTNATSGGSGDDQIDNPGSAGSKTITITGPSPDSGTLAVPILTDDQVVVSATVDPSITSVLSSNTCALGTLSISAINTCNYYNRINTNAGSGYTSKIADLNTTTAGKLCSPSEVVCTNDINRTTGNVDQGSEEYGVGTDKAGQGLADYGTGPGSCTSPANPQPATALPSDQTYLQYASAAAPVSNDDTYLCHTASIAGTSPSGTFTGTVTHITTGNF